MTETWLHSTLFPEFKYLKFCIGSLDQELRFGIFVLILLAAGVQNQMEEELMIAVGIKGFIYFARNGIKIKISPQNLILWDFPPKQ